MIELTAQEVIDLPIGAKFFFKEGDIKVGVKVLNDRGHVRVACYQKGRDNPYNNGFDMIKNQRITHTIYLADSFDEKERMRHIMYGPGLEGEL